MSKRRRMATRQMKLSTKVLGFSRRLGDREESDAYFGIRLMILGYFILLPHVFI